MSFMSIVHSLVILTPEDSFLAFLFDLRTTNNLHDTGDDEDCRKNFDCYNGGDKIGINVWLIVISLLPCCGLMRVPLF